MNWNKIILKSFILFLLVAGSSVGFAQMVGGGFYNKSSIEGFNLTDWYINYRKYSGIDPATRTVTTAPSYLIIDSNKATLTNDQQQETSCIYNKKTFFIQKGFKVSFTYNAKMGSSGGIADGSAFVLQSQGPGAMGATGGSLGFFNYSSTSPGISNGVALALNLFTSGEVLERKNVGFKFAKSQYDVKYTNNVSGPFDFEEYQLLKSGDDIQVKMDYDRPTKKIRVELQQSGSPLSSKVTEYAGIELNSLVGNKPFWVGFCGTTGGVTSTQVISNFKFSSF